MDGILETFLLAMTPIGELRAALPVALVVYKLPWWLAYAVSVVGNLVPVILLLLFLEPISKWLSRNFRIFERFFNWLFARTRKKAETIKFAPTRSVSKLTPNGSVLALAVFVTIPLPITGGWTGALIAFLLGMPLRKSFPAITAGILGAGIIVALVTKAGIAINKYFGLPTLLAVLFIVTISFVVYRKLKSATK